MRPSAILLIFLISAPTAVRAESKPSLRKLFVDAPGDVLQVSSTKSGKPLTAAERAKLVTLDDRKNGYLTVKGTDDTDIFGGGQLVLFKTKSGSFLLGWHVDSNGDGTENIQMFRKSGETWTDVTSEVLPKITAQMVDEKMQQKVPAFKKAGKKLTDCASGTYAYKLPRQGTTVEVHVASDCYAGPKLVLWHLKFGGEQFTLAD